MTEQEWLTSSNPVIMLEFLRAVKLPPDYHNHASERKLRLYACACARQVWHLLTDERSRRAVELAEVRADEPSMPVGAWGRVNTDAFDVGVCYSQPHPARLAHDCLCDEPVSLELECVPAHLRANLLREIIGNPFHRAKHPVWASKTFGDLKDWVQIRLDPTVQTLSQAAYRDRLGDGTLDALTLLALADALEEAGCVMELCGVCGQNHRRHPLLAHLRSDGPHVRGCWALDAILGRS